MIKLDFWPPPPVEKWFPCAWGRRCTLYIILAIAATSVWFRLRNDVYCVGWGVKLHSLALPPRRVTHSARRRWVGEISGEAERRTFRSCRWRRCAPPSRRARRRRSANRERPSWRRRRPRVPSPSATALRPSSSATPAATVPQKALCSDMLLAGVYVDQHCRRRSVTITTFDTTALVS